MRWVLLVVAGISGATWWIASDPGAEPRAASGSPPPVSRGVTSLQRPPSELKNSAADPRPVEAGSAESVEDRLATAPAAPAIRDALAQSAALKQSGQDEAARAVLREALGRGLGAAEAGLAAFALAPLEPDPARRRQLLGVAFRGGALSGPEWDTAGSLLRELDKNPRASVQGLIRTVQYQVKSGDSLWRICNKALPDEHGLHVETGLLRLVNGLADDRLDVGQELVVPTEPLRIEIHRHEHGLVAWLGDVPVAAYQIGLGKDGRTPSGSFVIDVKQEHPDWYRDGRRIPYGDPENLLGTRWMGFRNTPGLDGYGIHGTDRPETIGMDESMGCVRMRNPDVEALFALVPRGTTVLIP